MASCAKSVSRKKIGVFICTSNRSANCGAQHGVATKIFSCARCGSYMWRVLHSVCSRKMQQATDFTLTVDSTTETHPDACVGIQPRSKQVHNLNLYGWSALYFCSRMWSTWIYQLTDPVEHLKYPHTKWSECTLTAGQSSPVELRPLKFSGQNIYSRQSICFLPHYTFLIYERESCTSTETIVCYR